MVKRVALVGVCAVVLLTASLVVGKQDEPAKAPAKYTATTVDAKLLSQEQIEGKAKKPKEGHVSTRLMTYAQFEEVAAKAGGAKVRNHLVDDARMVWVIETNYPNGQHTKAGLIQNAEEYAVYDAETGDAITVLYTAKK